MKVIVMPRGAGKTTQLIKMADNYDGYIVCMDVDEVIRIANQAKRLKCKINFPITFHEFKNDMYHGTGVKKFYIDEVLSLIRYLARGIEVKAITYTPEEYSRGSLN